MTELVWDVADLAHYVSERLLNGGFTIQRYNSYTTNSIYLKLDYGVMNSIRISDHKGKKHLKYRYNLLSNRKGVRKHYNGVYPRYFYGFDYVEDMLIDIFRDKVERLTKYGPNNYRRYMQESVENNLNKKGFWSQCVELI